MKALMLIALMLASTGCAAHVSPVDPNIMDAANFTDFVLEIVRHIP